MRYLSATFFMLFLVNCSESEEETDALCELEESSEISMEDSFAYTGEQVIVKGEFCLNQTLKVLINDVGYDLVEISLAQVSFTMPEISEDSVTVKIQSDGVVLDFSQKIAVYPGNGSWQERASFPASGRGFAKSASANNMGYLISGSNYLGHTEEQGHAYEYYKDLYQYGEESNTWSLINSHDNFGEKGYVVGNDESIYVFPFSVFSNTFQYTLNSSTFESISSIGVRGSFYPFLEDNDVYHFIVQNETILVLKKYSAANNEWQIVSTFELGLTGNASAFINFAFVKEGVAYVGYNQINSGELVMLSTNLEDFVISEKARVEVDNNDIVISKYLFTINDLAYFSETGTSWVGPGEAVVQEPGDKLYIFNLKSETWRVIEHSLPESFYSVSSFGLNNRGFAGLGYSGNGSLFSYSQKLYEFIPN